MAVKSFPTDFMAGASVTGATTLLGDNGSANERYTLAQVLAYLQSAGLAPLYSPTFTGVPQGPAPTGTAPSTQLATIGAVLGIASSLTGDGYAAFYDDDDIISALTDADGNVISSFDINAKFSVVSMETAALTRADEYAAFHDADTASFSIVDAAGNVQAASPSLRPLTGVGLRWAYNPATGAKVSDESDILEIVIVTGQSLSLGETNSTGATAVSTSAVYADRMLMFDNGAVPNYGQISSTVNLGVNSFVDLYEQDYAAIGSYETICSGAATSIADVVGARTGVVPRMLWFAVGKGGNALGYDYSGIGTYEGLARGSTTFEQALNFVGRAKALAEAQGLRVVARTLIYVGGEADSGIGTTQADMIQGYMALRDEYEAGIREMTGQSEPLVMYIGQANRGSSTAGTEIAAIQAALDVQFRDPRIICCGPRYWIEHDPSDTAHPTPTGYRQLGIDIGQRISEARTFGKYSNCLFVERAWRSSSTVVKLRFTKPIAIETTDARVTVSTLGAGKGVILKDGAGTSQTISSIAVDGTDARTLNITLSAPFTGYGLRVVIAMQTTGSNAAGPVTGARSGIRSSAVWATDGANSYYEWACAQAISVES